MALQRLAASNFRRVTYAPAANIGTGDNGIMGIFFEYGEFGLPSPTFVRPRNNICGWQGYQDTWLPRVHANVASLPRTSARPMRPSVSLGTSLTIMWPFLTLYCSVPANGSHETPPGVHGRACKLCGAPFSQLFVLNETSPSRAQPNTASNAWRRHLHPRHGMPPCMDWMANLRSEFHMA